MPDLSAVVHAQLVANQLIDPAVPLVVAVSGGPDSLCLLHVLRSLYAGAAPLHVAHLDHMIRGAESAAEARFVAELARTWGLPATIAAVDVPALAARDRLNLHAAARHARHAFLARVARDTGAAAVAVAHHANDQAETVLLHLLRGAGPEGLGGMRPVVPWPGWAGDGEPGGLAARQAGSAVDQQISSGAPAAFPPFSASLIRPLLGVSRGAIERYCAEHGLEPQRDPSNHDWLATRNRIRHDLLPRLIEYNPHIVAALGRTAQICADEQDFLAEALDRVWLRLALVRPGGVDVDGAAWRGLHPALQRAALRRAYALLAHGDTLTLEHVEQARALVARGVGRRLDLPGGVLLAVGYAGGFTLGAPAPPDGPQLPAETLCLPEHGAVALGAGWSIVVSRGAAPAPAPWALLLDAERLPGPLSARRRRPADRLRLAADRGSRRVQDLLVDARVPQALRPAWPIVVAGEALVWVVGVRAAGAYRASPASRHVVRIELVRAEEAS